MLFIYLFIYDNPGIYWDSHFVSSQGANSMYVEY